MRLTREKSYGDLARGHEQCWKISDSSEAEVDRVTAVVVASGLRVEFACMGEEDGNGFSTEMILDTNDVPELKAIYAEAKLCQPS